MEEITKTPQQIYLDKINEVLNLIGARYHDKLNGIYAFGDYKIKPMFAEKYSIAYTAMLDDEAQGKEIVINASVYNAQGILVNVDFNKDEFLDIYRAVKDIYIPIEKTYQQFLAELSQQPTMERLQYIVEHNEF